MSDTPDWTPPSSSHFGLTENSANQNEIRRAAGHGGYGWKRAVDLVAATLLLLFSAPLLALIWLFVRASSPGPGLFWSKRVGRNGRMFLMPKFRTMVQNAPSRPREALGDVHAHVTHLGAILRRWSLDELPQLYSILRGDMSFIGPRPLLPDDPAQAARRSFPSVYAVRPGLSGLAQVRGRNLVRPVRKARLDAFYARRLSLRLDFLIAAQTFVILLTGRGFI